LTLLEAAKKALSVAEGWIHDQRDGTSGLEGALAELDDAREAIQRYDSEVLHLEATLYRAIERAKLLTRPGLPFDVVHFIEQWEKVVRAYDQLQSAIKDLSTPVG
jgi:hypothetical protein